MAKIFKTGIAGVMKCIIFEWSWHKLYLATLQRLVIAIIFSRRPLIWAVA